MNQSTSTLHKRCLAVLTLVIGIVLGVRAESVEIDGLYYELNTTERTAALTYQNTGTSNYSTLPTDIVIPATVSYNNVAFTVTSITDRAFSYCTSLETISIPNTIQHIGTAKRNTTDSSNPIYLPFYNCTSLKTVRFEDGLEQLLLGTNCYNYTTNYEGYGLFYSCPLEEVYLGRNIAYSEYNTSYAFSVYPQRYGYSAFYNQNKLTKVTIGETVTDIPAYLFYKNSSLTSVVILGKLKSVPQHAFDGCSALKSAILPNSVSSIYAYAFNECSSIEMLSLGLPTEIGEYAFYNTSSLSEIEFPQTLSSIGQYAFTKTGINNVILPNSVTSISNNAFSASKVQSVNIGNGTMTLGEQLFYNCQSLVNLYIGGGVKEIPYACFENCVSLKELTLDDGIQTISDRAFSGCNSLETISFPNSIQQIGTARRNTADSSNPIYLPFYNCTSLKTVRFEDGLEQLLLGTNCYNYTTNYEGYGLFYSCPLEEVYLGRNIAYSEYNTSYAFSVYPQRYGYSAFYNQPKLAKVTIGNTVTEIPDYLFYNNASITLMTLPNVERIGLAAFRGCSKLTTLNLGDALTTVGDEAFYGCTNVTKLTFPNTTQSIGASAFYNCSSVTEVTVGTGLKSIGDYAFYGCKSFTALILPNEFKTMGEAAFSGCTKLTVAKLGETIEAIPAKAFMNCTSLSEMVVPGTAVSIGDQAFYNDSGLATITMNEGLKTIGNQVFWNNSGVIRFTIPGTVTSIGSNSFYGCTNVAYLTFSDGEETLTINNASCRSSIIDAQTSNSTYYNRRYDYFYDCPIRFLTLGRNLKYSYYDDVAMYDLVGTTWKSVNRASAPFVNKSDLRSVTIGPKVTFLYHHLFDGCTNLATLRMGAAIETIHTYAFKNCDALKSVEFPWTLKSIESNAFYNCDLLASTIYHDATDRTLSIGSNAFEKCIALTDVTYPGNLVSLGASSYKECTALHTTLFNNSTVADSRLEINDYTFSNCTVLKTVKFPDHLYKIHNYVYEYCPTLNELSFPANLISIGNYVFKNSAFLTDIKFEDSSKAITLGYGAGTGTTSTADVSSTPLFGNSNLQSLYIGRNITYDAKSTYGYSPFYNQNFLTDVKFSQAGMVTYSHDYLLYKVNNCEELLLPESLTSIGTYTFAGMSVLKGIIIPNKVNTIGTYAFSTDDGLKFAKLSGSCAWLQEGLFNHCDSLESITIPPVVTKMDTKLFANCKSLATVTFEGSTDLIDMGYGASQTQYGMFRDCPVETLNLDRWLSYNTGVPSRSPFYSIPTLKNINIGENVGVIDKYMFSYCTGLEELYLPDNIESVGLWGFRGCSALKSVRFSEKLSQVSDYGFSECTSLDNVVFPASMTSIADNSFSNCSALKRLDLGQNLNIIGPAAFKNDTSLEGIEIPETLYGLGVEAFAYCTSLPNVSIRAISSVGKQAFQGCTGLKWVSLCDKTTSLGENSFAGCTGINYIKSFAEFPPEGLVNFPAEVVENGTLFVPEYSVDYYQYSPTWEEWYSIRPLNDNILVSSVSLDKSEISFKASETSQLTAEVGAEDATDKAILWRSSNDSIVSVDETGLVTGVSVGEATVTALAADGSGEKATCQVTVLPTMVESIAINSGVTSLKKGRTLELTAIVMPATATDATYSWSTSNAAVATIDSDGVVNAVTAGNVNIIATANDGSGISTSFALTVVPPTKGDSNDNDVVTISDAVNTANYAVGNEVENFNVEAADVNNDNRITLSDASATVAIVLEQPVEMASMAKVRGLSSMTNDEFDLLVIADYTARVGETTSVSVTLDNTLDYVALQADVAVPEGMKLVGVNIGSRSEVNHSFAIKRVDDRSMRVTLFDLNNSAFADNNDPILELIVKVNNATTDRIEINNILASDAMAREYVLTSIGGNNSEMSGLENVRLSNIRIEAIAGGIDIYGAVDCEVAIYAVDGTTLSRFVASSDHEHLNVVPGIYIVVAGNHVEKVVVK